MIKVKNLSKIYKLYQQPQDRLKEALHPLRKKYHHDFYALKDINFEVKKGETIGIIGQNGSGKSTLLKILTSVLTPSGGNYEIWGKVSSLLELGTGFNPDLSGLENIYFYGSILGFSRVEIDEKIDDILQFADIGEFIHQSVKTYSSGMYVRLAFAVAIQVDPDILIVDEALSVGDIKFQLKCFRKFAEFQESGKTILFVTHDTGAVQNYCSRAIWLNDGEVKEIGKPEAICKHYMSFMAYGDESKKQLEERVPEKIKSDKLGQSIPWRSIDECEGFGEGGSEITQVAFYDSKTMESLDVLEGGESVSLAFKIKGNKEMLAPIAGFTLTDEKGNNIFGTNTSLLENKFKNIKEGRESELVFSFVFPKLKNQKYTFSVAVGEGSMSNHEIGAWIHDAIVITVCNISDFANAGYLLIDDKIKIKQYE